MINRKEKGYWKKILEILFESSFTTSSARLSKFDGRSVVLFQTKDFGGNISLRDHGSEIFHKSNWAPWFYAIKSH